MSAEPVEWIEVDVDFCTRTFGIGACDASLSASTRAKCFNTTETCSARHALDLGKLTLRFIEPRSNLPKGGVWFPCL